MGLPAFLVSKPMAWCLLSCEWLVELAEKWPVHQYVGPVPMWWVVVFYGALFVVCTSPRIRWRWLVPGAAGWLSEHGAASGGEELPEPQQVETAARSVQAAELDEDAEIKVHRLPRAAG